MTPRELARIHAACFTVPRPWSETEFGALLASNGVFLCVAEAGFALGRLAGPEAELLTLAVQPDQQGQGQGRNLLQEFERHAHSKGAEETFLEVAVTNERAIRLYSSAGYVETGFRRNYYAGPNGARISCLVMKKSFD